MSHYLETQISLGNSWDVYGCAHQHTAWQHEVAKLESHQRQPGIRSSNHDYKYTQPGIRFKDFTKISFLSLAGRSRACRYLLTLCHHGSSKLRQALRPHIIKVYETNYDLRDQLRVYYGTQGPKALARSWVSGVLGGQNISTSFERPPNLHQRKRLAF